MGVSERSTRKKLKLAARRWAGAKEPARAAARVDDNVVAGLRATGVKESAIEAFLLKEQESAEAQAAQEAAQDAVEIYEDNWDSWLFFLRVETQWVWVSSGMRVVRVGINSAGVESTARLMGIPRSRWPALLDDLQVMEQAVLAADAELARAND